MPVTGPYTPKSAESDRAAILCAVPEDDPGDGDQLQRILWEKVQAERFPENPDEYGERADVYAAKRRFKGDG